MCLGLYDEAAFAQMSQADSQKVFEECKVLSPEKNRKVSNMKTAALIFIVLLSTAVSACNSPQPVTPPVNGLKMYYEIHGSGEPVVLLPGAFMTITNNWTGWIGELSKTRKGKGMQTPIKSSLIQGIQENPESPESPEI